MALIDMDFNNIGGALVKASSWSEAVNNANNFIIAIVTGTYDNANYNFSFVVPKIAILSTNTVFCNGASHPSNSWYVNIIFSETTAVSYMYRNGTSEGVTVSTTYYYD